MIQYISRYLGHDLIHITTYHDTYHDISRHITTLKTNENAFLINEEVYSVIH